MGKVRIVLVALCLWAGSSAGLANEGGGGGEEGGMEYLPLEAVLVNLAGKRHYLRADIQLLVESKEDADKIKAHMPLIRHTLIMLFSNRDPAEIAAVAEREKLRQSALEQITASLEQVGADHGLEDLFFTDFMVQ
ncbi:flagellar FliL protein [Methylomagnum ishizawai]|uniref:Flagellar protein FliL n=1 Tax=Methylomagnum ishizawai TaxID=1760988 RepID=A0A1Y6D3B0_9GAMM|nr:flagellar basal body-associated FliL family protein [Methylomagnum ishizawai]SMF95032.1 flagellar FliL protein [Methylomagnum ishizawai]